MESSEIRKKFLEFFQNRGHKIIPSASLVPENDPSVLFNTAGMQPLVPYLLGQHHPMGSRLANSQKCVRTVDIDEVGDNRHLTFFEMLGNWSLGDYFKEESIKWSFEFLTSKKEGLGFDPSRLYITVFEGDNNAPRDEEAAKIWGKYIPKNRIYFLPAKNNWWSAGDNGPCGPDTEIFYDIGDEPLGDLSHEEFVRADTEGKVVEIWNNVFMEYEMRNGKVVGKLKQWNVDTGMGLERIAMVSQKVKTVFETDLFGGEKTREERIVADHLKAALFMVSDGVIPGNTGRGYVLRRLIRRAVRFSKNSLAQEIEKVKNVYKGVYVLDDNGEIEKEENRFRIILKNVNNILEEIKKLKGVLNFSEKIQNPQGLLGPFKQGLEYYFKDENTISGQVVFHLVQSWGMPFDSIKDFAQENGFKIDIEDFENRFKNHQKLSQTSSAGMFKGGLANHGEKVVRLHTAHHLLLAGLQAIVDKNIKQRGSNITEERLRMDFLCDHKLTDEEKKEVEDWVNDKIKKSLNVVRREMPLAEAEKLGAEMEFGAKYPDIVSIYFVEDAKGNVISKEFCGGPHVQNTGELGQFKIQKEEAVAQGIRRIKAVLM